MRKTDTKVRRVPAEERELLRSLELSVREAHWRAVDAELSREGRRVAMEERWSC